MSLSDAQTALDILGRIIGGIGQIMAWRAHKKQEKDFRMNDQNLFLRQFIFAGAPSLDHAEDHTIKSYCDKLLNVIQAHATFIFGKGAKKAEAAHAVIAATAFHMAAWPGLPQALPPPAPRPPSPLNATLANTYNGAITRLSDILRLLEANDDYNVTGLTLTLQAVDQDLTKGFAIGANLQAAQNAAQMVIAPSYGASSTTSTIDEQTSQTNLIDLMSSQSSPAEIDAAYDRAETRCLQSISRPPSPLAYRNTPQMNYIAMPATPAPSIFSAQTPYPAAECIASVPYYSGGQSSGSRITEITESRSMWELENMSATGVEDGSFSNRCFRRTPTWS